jgi:hypothetical protein
MNAYLRHPNAKRIKLHDVGPKSDAILKVEITNEGDGCTSGLGISLEDHQTKTSAEGFADTIVHLEFCDGKPILRVWADINSEEPTHTIDLSGAHVGRRLTTFSGHLYFVDDSGTKTHLTTFEVQAESAKVMEKKVLDEHWDHRLDAASCSPYFEYEAV